MSHSCATIVLLVATLLAFGNSSRLFGHDPELGLLNYMARSNDMMQQDPARSLDCFNKYIPLINEIASKYETNFNGCLNKSEVARSESDEATLQQRNELANDAEASCNLLKQCPENQSVDAIFQCYIEGGSTNIKTMYTINANASQHLAELREQYYLITHVEYKCTNETKRVYEKDTAEAYAALNNCILGKDEVVPTIPTTTQAASTSTVPETTTTAETPTIPTTTQTTSTSTVSETPESPETTATAETSTSTIESTSAPEAEVTTPDSVSTTASPEENTSENPEQ